MRHNHAVISEHVFVSAHMCTVISLFPSLKTYSWELVIIALNAQLIITKGVSCVFN